MILSEAELVNAICLHIAERKSIRPQDVSVELIYDDETGFSAEIVAAGREQVLIEANLAEAVSRYLWKEYGKQAYRDSIAFRLENEIIAVVK
ncbi:DUF2653 family protein [Paenibacillus alkalitolerans]|uniref:DUF2653 family protein n=1 Tax=Paenibacillus alkalitolerans TaxID=2799335 RepID=UPI0018F52797|nr:DUF2653 family protein [Paenibacillus alkalitolerans]